MTQVELGRALGPWVGEWSKQTVSHAERGRRDFTAEELVALSACLRQPLGFFFGNGEGPIEFSGGHRILIRELSSIVHLGRARLSASASLTAEGEVYRDEPEQSPPKRGRRKRTKGGQQ
jgi:transcriptional regulator with XRE-family HTH domain